MYNPFFFLFNPAFSCTKANGFKQKNLPKAVLAITFAALQSHAYRRIDVPVVQMTMLASMLVVKVIELSVGIDEVAFPVVSDRKARSEVQGKAVVARVYACALYFTIV